jgi:hypothetical protein
MHIGTVACWFKSLLFELPCNLKNTCCITRIFTVCAFLFVANCCGWSDILDIHTAYQAGNTATNCECDEAQAFSWNETWCESNKTAMNYCNEALWLSHRVCPFHIVFVMWCMHSLLRPLPNRSKL